MYLLQYTTVQQKKQDLSGPGSLRLWLIRSCILVPIVAGHIWLWQNWGWFQLDNTRLIPKLIWLQSRFPYPTWLKTILLVILFIPCLWLVMLLPPKVTQSLQTKNDAEIHASVDDIAEIPPTPTPKAQ
jgi:hypothetical protein